MKIAIPLPREPLFSSFVVDGCESSRPWRFILILICAFYLCAGLMTAESSTLETIPLYHWCYDVIDELTLRGYLADLASSVKPFTRSQVFQSLAKCQIPPQDLTSLQLLNLLNSEFLPQSEEKIKTGLYLIQDLKADDSELAPRSAAVSKLGYSLRDKFTMYNGMRLDQNLQDDSLYSGAYWRGFSGYTEQAYIAGRIGPIRLQFGKDWQRWGSGRFANLLISENPLPYDLFKFNVAAGSFNFTSLILQLDAVTVIDSVSQPGEIIKSHRRRFLAAHRLDWQISRKMQLGIAESVLYGGENRTFEWQFLNPVVFYHGEQENRGFEGNTLVSADFKLFPGKKWFIYGEFLVDDWQFDRKKVSDLEPAEIGWIIGARKAEPWGWKTASAGFEYSGVTNRTYNTLQVEQKYLAENHPLGHRLGNDFDSWTIELTNWISPRLRADFLFAFLRNGESSVYAPFDTSFYAVPEVSMGYEEPFPTGIVERTYRPELKFFFYYNRICSFHGNFRYDYIENYLNTKGRTEEDFILQFGVTADLSFYFSTNGY